MTHERDRRPGEDHRKREHPPVDAHALDAGDVAGRSCLHRANETGRQRNPQPATDREQHGGFRQRFADDMPSRGAQRETNRQVVRTRGAAHEQETSDVGTGHGEQDQHRREQRPQRRTGVAEQFALQRHDRDIFASAARVIALRQIVERNRQIGVRGLRRHAGLHAPDDLEPSDAAIVDVLGTPCAIVTHSFALGG